MPWKMDENGVLAVGEDKNPVWISEAGVETPVDYSELTKRLSEANARKNSQAEKLREMEARFAPLTDIEDIPAFLAEAREAMEMKAHAPDRDKDIEEQVKTRLEAVAAPLKQQLAAREKLLADKDKTIAEVTGRYHAVTVKTDVLNSKLLKERIKPENRPFLERELMRSGTVDENGKVVYRDDNGEVIYDAKGDPATADDAAIATIKRFGLDPATILLSTDTNSGSGAQPSPSGGAMGSRKSYADCKTLEEKAAWLKKDNNLKQR